MEFWRTWFVDRRTTAGFVIGCVALLLALPASAGTPYVQGDVFAGVGAGQIKHFKPDGTLVQTLNNTTNSSEQTGMCFDDLGNLYSTNFTANNMSKFDASGNLLAASWGSGFNQHPESCVFDFAGHIFVGQADGGRQILEFDTAGTPINSWSPATQSRGTDFVELGADGCTMYYTSEGTSVKRYDVCTSTQLPDFATGLPGSCFALRLRPNGEILVACTSQVVRLDTSGTSIQTYPASGFTPAASFLFALNLDPDDATFWTGDIFSGDVYRINIASGSQMTHFNAGILGGSMAGLAVFGEITGIGPTPPPTAPPEPIPTATGRGLIVFIGLLVLAGILVLWRRTN